LTKRFKRAAGGRPVGRPCREGCRSWRRPDDPPAPVPDLRAGRLLRRRRGGGPDTQQGLRLWPCRGSRLGAAGKPQAAPDSGKAHYSDTNFQLLGAVIEAATGLSYGEALHERICDPLGLSRTALFDPTRDGNGPTLPVYHKSQVLDIPLILSSMGPDGGIVSDTGDLMTFLRAFMEGRCSGRAPAHPAPMAAPLFSVAVRRRIDAVQAARLDDALAALAGTDRPFRSERNLRLSRAGAGHFRCRHLQPDRCAEAPLRLYAGGSESHRNTWRATHDVGTEMAFGRDRRCGCPRCHPLRRDARRLFRRRPGDRRQHPALATGRRGQTSHADRGRPTRRADHHRVARRRGRRFPVLARALGPVRHAQRRLLRSTRRGSVRARDRRTV
jgi:hypothetical protein